MGLGQEVSELLVRALFKFGLLPQVRGQEAVRVEQALEGGLHIRDRGYNFSLTVHIEQLIASFTSLYHSRPSVYQQDDAPILLYQNDRRRPFNG